MNVVSFVNMKGGVGKTTLAVTIADALSRRNRKKVLLVDLDPQFNATQCLYSGADYVKKRKAGGHTIVSIFNDSPSLTVSAVHGQKSVEPTSLDDIVPWRFRENFYVIPGDLEIYRLEMSAGQGREQRLKRYIDKARAADLYDIVIIDTPPTPSHFMMSALLASNFYLIPVKPEPLSRVGIDLLNGVIQRCSENYGHDIKCAGVVITMADLRTRVLEDTIAFLDQNATWKDKRFRFHLPQRTAVAREQGVQKLILGMDDVETRRALAGIANELLERIGDE